MNSAINLVGAAAPLAAAILAFPALNRFLGTDRVGFLTLAWALIGYFGLFDLGIGRALTKLVAERAKDDPSLGPLIWTAMALMSALGGAAAAGMAVMARPLVQTVLKIPEPLQQEATSAIRILALAVPFVVTSAGFRGVLEAQGYFLTVNAIRAPLGVWLVAGPLLLVPFAWPSLAALASVLLLGRVAAWLAFAWASLAWMKPSLGRPSFHLAMVGPLLHFGGWMTVSNIASPLMVYMDRFLLGALMSLEAVAWYATPWEVVTKALVLPGAAITVLFPVFSSLMSTDRRQADRVYSLSSRWVGLAMFVPTFALALFSGKGSRYGWEPTLPAMPIRWHASWLRARS